MNNVAFFIIGILIGSCVVLISQALAPGPTQINLTLPQQKEEWVVVGVEPYYPWRIPGEFVVYLQRGGGINKEEHRVINSRLERPEWANPDYNKNVTGGYLRWIRGKK